MFKLLLETLFSPNRALRRVADERPVLSAAVITLLGAWGWAFSAHVAHRAQLVTHADFCAPFFPSGGNLLLLVHEWHLFVVWLVFIPVALLSWFLRTGMMHLLAELLGGSGKAFSGLAVVGFADLPLLLLLPTAWLCSRAGSSVPMGVATMWYVAAAALHLWSATLAVLGVRHTHRLHTGTAAAIFIIILAAFAAVSILLAFAAPKGQ